jgi:colicin import membrane protein
MKAYQSHILSAVVSIALHGMLVAGLLLNWNGDEERRVIEPQYLSATLVAIAPAKKSQVSPPVKVSDEAKRRLRQRELELNRRKAEVQALRQAEEDRQVKRALVERLKKEREAAVEAEAKAERERLARMRREQLAADLAEAISQEQLLLKSEEEERSANSYRQLIQKRLSESWSRPPSARRGMETMIRLQLVPTGRVVGVTILNSSGDAAFDRSVELAAFKVNLVELQSMPAALFEKKFRQVNVLFSPQDLRL